MNECDWKIILGPPGTGKTTTLLSYVSDKLAAGVDPRNICFVAFTRKAANEAKYRAYEQFSFTDEDLPYFRTLHSLAYRELGLSKTQVFGIRDLYNIANMLGLYITAKGIQEDGTVIGLSKGDRLFFMEAMARARMMTLDEYCQEYGEMDITHGELYQVAETIHKYKEVHGKIDFSDMLSMYIEGNSVPPIDVLIVDEAQDLSPLQWKLVRKLAAEANDVVIAGDDDQAIFTWAGADVKQFIGLTGTKTVLAKSYRCPKEVFELASKITDAMNERLEKRYLPAEGQGSVNYVQDLTEIDMSAGSWLLLGRNVYLLQSYVDFCMDNGYVFDSIIGSPAKSEDLHAIVAWENLRKGHAIQLGEVRKIYERMTMNKGFAYGSKKLVESKDIDTLVDIYDLMENYGLLTKGIWHQALDRLSAKVTGYFLAARKQGEKLLKNPRILVNTIHGVKGGEADNVVLFTDMAARTHNEYLDDPDPEHRVWYVGITRAKKALYIVQPTTSRCYEEIL